MTWRFLGLDRPTLGRLARRFFPRLMGLGRPPGAMISGDPPEGPDYLFWALIDWHYRLQRPQHLARELARTGRRIFYISPNFVDHPKPGFRVEALDREGRLYQVFLQVRGAPSIYFEMPSIAAQRQLSASVSKLVAWAGIQNPISLVQHPFWSHLASVPAPAQLVYDRMDLHEGFHFDKDTYSTGLSEAERALFGRADLTILSSAWLDQDTAPHTERRLLLRNAVDFQHFATKPEAAFRDPAGRQVIGYFGAIAEWMDLGLVEATARRFPDCLILLIGHDQCRAKQYLSGLPNVRLTGELPYARLPYYLHGFDVCILPFRRIPLTLATNPVKVYEYLSAGKPVVSVALPEMEALSHLVTVAEDEAGFLHGIDEALAEGAATTDPSTLRQAFAAGQTWTLRCETLRRAVEEDTGYPDLQRL